MAASDPILTLHLQEEHKCVFLAAFMSGKNRVRGCDGECVCNCVDLKMAS